MDSSFAYGHVNTKSIAKIPATFVPLSHTILGYCAFFVALVVGCYTQYEKIVQNQYYGYPQEYIPSVSATTGDRYPARAYFQILIALTSGPRFLLVYLWFLYSTRVARTSSVTLGKTLLAIGTLRTLACGGWVYITSTDDHDLHDIAMGLYLLCTLPWQWGVLCTSNKQVAGTTKWRRILLIAFFGSTPFMVYYFIQHKVHQVPGAYSMYAIFEWSLILYDIGFDAVSFLDFQSLEIVISDVMNITHKKEDV
ncbi:fgf receptor activating protein [Hesseltinella vesiculosa]|uniref:Fgf receptor activating protein n=1 Tax=Hesseltinella vesiculosa TaxID=101127 RepID=A0A1X2GUH7_9FUNG|nr:fgf receptor activating protein [Hesseltinella vesiculosa]